MGWSRPTFRLVPPPPVGRADSFFEPSRTEPAKAFRFSDLNSDSLKLFDGDKAVLVYNHGVITNERMPKTDSRRSRACYIHPLWGLEGERLTDDFPRDHYHHHGIFWAWPHVGIGDDQYDLWEYKNIKQRFVRWLARESGPVAAVLGVENGWFVGREEGYDRTSLDAVPSCRRRRAIPRSELCLDSGRSADHARGAEGKSYGGLTVRFAVRDAKKTAITVPSGLSRRDLPETPLPWADLTSTFPGATEAQRRCPVRRQRSPGLPSNLADAPLWATVRRLAGRQRQDV